MKRRDAIKGLIVGTPAAMAAGCTRPTDPAPRPAAGVTLTDFAAKPVDREALIASLGLEFTAAERALVFPLLDGFHAQGDGLDKIPDPALPVKYPRERGARPADADNTLGAWYWRMACCVQLPHCPFRRSRFLRVGDHARLRACGVGDGVSTSP